MLLVQPWGKPRSRWAEERAASGDQKKNTSVVIHFKDAAFDDAHVSVPHTLVPAGGKKQGTHREVKLSLMSKAKESTSSLTTNAYCEIGANEAIFV